ncbi:MAG: type III pantothenate kinase [Nitrospinota bacterium]
MLLVIDVGNTHTVAGVFRASELLVHWRVTTLASRTADEFGILLRDLFGTQNARMDEVDAIAVSCVVPPLLTVLEEVSLRFFGIRPLVVGPGVRTGLSILADNPREVGADRIVNAVAGIARYGCPLIVVDFGTATTFDAISREGHYVGGAIAPGILISLEALFEHAAKLPRVEIIRPEHAVGRNTISSMQSGILFGYVGLVKEMVSRIREEVGGNPQVVATGGEAELIARETDIIDTVDPYLTLEGLRLIYERNLNPDGHEKRS